MTVRSAVNFEDRQISRPREHPYQDPAAGPVFELELESVGHLNLFSILINTEYCIKRKGFT